MDHTVVQADIKCARCDCKAVLYLKLEKNQGSVSQNWKCPDCGADRTVTVKKSVPIETAKDVAPNPIKHYINNDGKRIEVDENGDPIETSSAFDVKTPRKRRVEDFQEI